LEAGQPKFGPFCDLQWAIGILFYTKFLQGKFLDDILVSGGEVNPTYSEEQFEGPSLALTVSDAGSFKILP